MPWQNASINLNHEGENLISINIQWTDAAEFATDVFTYNESRIDRTSASDRNAFKNRAEAAREAERTKRQKRATFAAAVLTFMNT